MNIQVSWRVFWTIIIIIVQRQTVGQIPLTATFLPELHVAIGTKNECPESGTRPTAWANFFSHSKSAKNEKTVATVHVALSYPSVSPPGCLADLSYSAHKDMKQLFHLSSPYISFQFPTSTVDYHMASPWEEHKIRHGIADKWLQHPTRVYWV